MGRTSTTKYGLWCKHESELGGSDLGSQFALMQQARHSICRRSLASAP
jgi:hypothetical protein